jgi:hypothetical protein
VKEIDPAKTGPTVLNACQTVGRVANGFLSPILTDIEGCLMRFQLIYEEGFYILQHLVGHGMSDSRI